MGVGGLERQGTAAVKTDGINSNSTEANKEYERVLSESLADNVDLEEAKARAEAAKLAVLGSLVEADFEEAEEGSFPPPGVEVVREPEGGSVGTYRCNMCGVLLLSEINLQNHLQTEGHNHNLALRSGVQGGARGRGKVYRGRSNANSDGTMKAQRGRRGLISNGELMPDKLSKSQKKAQPKDIAAFLAQKTAEAGLESSGDVRRHAPLLMNFVKGGVMEGNQ